MQSVIFKVLKHKKHTLLAHPIMSTKNTVFYRGKKEVLVDFSAQEISSDGALIYLEQLERKHGLLKRISSFIPDNRNPLHTTFDRYTQLKQRIFMLTQGYEDVNDVNHLKNDPLFKDILQGDLASQPTISRFENCFDKASIFSLCYDFIDRYVESLEGREEIVIDVDATNDPTHGKQQLTMFNGFYEQFMYNELFFHDGETGQIILPVLRPGNSHSNKWYAGILTRIVKRIREMYPNLKITIRTDSGFSCPDFYQVADKYSLFFATGIASNNILKNKVLRAEKAVRKLYLEQGKKHQHFIEYTYQAKSWDKPQKCYAKIESTGIGMNVRHFVSNIEEKEAREIYFDFYVKRGDRSENRIKEVKNMCFSDRLSNHSFTANFFRLMMSSISYEFMRLIKEEIKLVGDKTVQKWQISSIRTYLLKVGATIKITKRRVYYKLSKAFVYQNLFRKLIALK